MMELLSDSDADVRRAAAGLAEGRLAAFPTETVYGLGADAFNPQALAAVFEAKGRPRFDPLIIHIARLEDLERVADPEALPAGARGKMETLCRRFWPGPLSLVLPRRAELPGLATSGLPSAAIRFPSHPAAQKLIRYSTGAVAAPSANLFGRLSPTTAEHVKEQLGERIDFLIDGGKTGVGLESTVLDLSAGEARLLRPGGVPREAIEDLIGPMEDAPGPLPGATPPSPGMLSSHYAPAQPLSLFPRGELERVPPAPCEGPCEGPQEGRLFFDAPSRERWGAAFPGALSAGVRVLSPAGDLKEAAANLFVMLHELESLPLRAILAEEAPPQGLGLAINDRLRRAAAR